MTIPKQIERLAFTTMAALTLAPIFLTIWWGLLTSTLGGHGDIYHVVLATWGVALAALIAQGLFNQYFLKGRDKACLISTSLAATVTGLGLAVILGNDSPSRRVIAIALILVGLFVTALITWLMAHLPPDLDGSAKQHPVKTALFVLLGLFAIWQTAHLSTFMADAKRIEHSMAPDIIFFVNHSCLTAYVQAVKFAQAGEQNLYDMSLWPDEMEEIPKRSRELATKPPYAPFYLDAYMYPPQFLLLPAALVGFTDNFMIQRAIWFGFSGMWVAMGFFVVAMWVSQKGQRDALWLLPLLWSTIIVLATLQVANVHHVVIVMIMLAMIAFERKQPVLGGALLAFAILSKISPVFFGLILLAQRRWKDAAWTAAFGVIYTILTAIVFGLPPLQSFLMYELPRLLSGEAMSWSTHHLINFVINMSPFAIPYKLMALGVHFDNVQVAARLTNSVYTLLLLGLTVFFALQPRDRYQKMYLWLGVMTLAALQSPFAPGYAAMPVFWILTLLAAESRKVAGGIAILIIWILLNIPATPTETSLMVSLFQQILLFAVIIFAMARKPTQVIAS